MTEGDLVTFETMSDMEEALSPFPGTEKTGVFSILRAIRPCSDIGKLDVVGKPSCLKKISQSIGFLGGKAEIDVDRHEFIMDGDPLASLMEKVKQS
jgi:hypothetical protein